MMKPYFKRKTPIVQSPCIYSRNLIHPGVYVNNIIDELHTTKVVTHTQSGCANRHRGGAEVSVNIILLYDIVW